MPETTAERPSGDFAGAAAGGGERVILRVLAMAQPGGVLLCDRVLRWGGVCTSSGSTGNATSICALVASLAKLAQELRDAPEMEEIVRRRAAHPVPAPYAAVTIPVGAASAAAALASSLAPVAGTAQQEEETDAPQQQQQDRGRVLSALFDNGAKITSALSKARRGNKSSSTPDDQQGSSSETASAAPATAVAASTASSLAGEQTDSGDDDDADEAPCVRMAVAPGKRTALCVFHVARPAPLLLAARATTEEYTRAVDAMLCAAADAFEAEYAADLDRLAPRIQECSTSDGAVVLTPEETRCFDGFVEGVVARACARASLPLCLAQEDNNNDDEKDKEDDNQKGD